MNNDKEEEKLIEKQYRLKVFATAVFFGGWFVWGVGKLLSAHFSIYG